MILKYRAKEGFSLVEMLISMAITAILMLTLIAILSYSSRSMRTTQAKVALQDQAKDAVNHISTYVQQSGNVKKSPVVSWNATSHVSSDRNVNINNTGVSEAAISSVDAYVYWLDGNHLYFREVDSSFDSSFHPEDPSSEVDASKLTGMSDSAKKQCLLADDVDGFNCSIGTTVNDSSKKVLHVTVSMADTYSRYECKKDIMMRNQ